MLRVVLVVAALLSSEAAIAQQSVIYLCVRKDVVRQVTTPVCAKKEKLQAIALVPGPPGVKGDKGDQGAQGPPGPVSSMRVVDGAGHDLGVYGGSQWDSGGMIFAFAESIGAILPVRSLGFLPHGPDPVFFANANCTGQPYLYAHRAAFALVSDEATPRLFAATVGAAGQYVVLSQIDGFACSAPPSSYADLVPAQDVTAALGFDFNAITAPIRVVAAP